jgi:hypothetical protein
MITRAVMVASALSLLSLAGTSESKAQTYPWCAYYDWSTYNCGFRTYQQCLATIQGTGGYCTRNPWYYQR